MPPEPYEIAEGYYFPVSPLLLFPRTKGKFGVYVKMNDQYRLYAHPDEPFSDDQRRKLYENGVTEVYVLDRQRRQFQNYLESHLGNTLDNDNLPMKERSKIFYTVSVSILKETFESKLPATLDKALFERIFELVTASTRFLQEGGSMKSLAKLITHDYQTYSHCVHVFVYTSAILQTFGIDEDTLAQVGLGAMLHDIGKALIPKEVLNKAGSLSIKERELMESHPVKGVAVCSQMPLTQEAVNVILFHHERMDGSGYPAGLAGNAIPLSVRAAAVADVYDALTSDRPYTKARSPFEALSTIRDDMAEAFDQEVLKRFVMVLSGAAVI
jgi:putative nucleotidyltransferase with HDIG domain